MANKQPSYKKYTDGKFIRFLFYIFIIGMLLLPVISLFMAI